VAYFEILFIRKLLVFSSGCIETRTADNPIKDDNYNVIVRRILATIVVVEKQCVILEYLRVV